MTTASDEYKTTWWLAEFANRDTELAFQRHMQDVINRQLRAVLFVWGALLLLFAVPDWTALGPTQPFYHLLSYRLIIVLSLLAVVFGIRPETDFFTISNVITVIVIVGFSGFMMEFYYRPDIVVWTVGVIMIQIMGLFMFVPIRFSLAFTGGLYGVVITMATRWVMGTSKANLIGLFFLLMLPFVLGAATAIRLNLLQRRQFTLLSKAEKINQELELEIDRRHKLELKLKEMAATDPLTGLYNRREYEMLFRHEIERARRLGSPLSVCIADLDHFKEVNDIYGHEAGDEVLRRTADLIRKNVRSMDIIGRLGGEEFIILLPEATCDGAAVTGNRILEALASTDIDVGAAAVRITATIGVTQLLPDDHDLNAAVQRADAAMYQGKEAGRNRVVTI
ncbi:MAG: GGDEF domain-containing protein [Deltaproteobacteria bacterium]|nr:GGDEF domain-containing protein [Deltaproteobacteria bacterium]